MLCAVSECNVCYFRFISSIHIQWSAVIGLPIARGWILSFHILPSYIVKRMGTQRWLATAVRHFTYFISYISGAAVWFNKQMVKPHTRLPSLQQARTYGVQTAVRTLACQHTGSQPHACVPAYVYSCGWSQTLICDYIPKTTTNCLPNICYWMEQ